MDVIVIESEAFYALIDKVIERMQPDEKQLNKWVDGKEAMEILKVKKTKLQELRDNGEIEVSKIGRIVLYNRFSLEDYIEKHKRKTF